MSDPVDPLAVAWTVSRHEAARITTLAVKSKLSFVTLSMTRTPDALPLFRSTSTSARAFRFGASSSGA